MLVGGKRHEQKCLDPKTIFAKFGLRTYPSLVLCLATEGKITHTYVYICIHKDVRDIGPDIQMYRHDRVHLHGSTLCVATEEKPRIAVMKVP